MEARNILISLTSYPARINTVEHVVDSLLKQSISNIKIVLWLAEEEFPLKEKELPEKLILKIDNRFSIIWCENIKSYKKLIPSLREFSDTIIVTADDDLLYPADWVEKLYQSYLSDPDYIHSHRCRRVYFSGKLIKSYNKWPFVNIKTKASFLNFSNSGAGMLIPPNTFNNEIFDSKLFQSLCPYGDDIWFWAMSVLNGVKTKAVNDGCSALAYVDGTQVNHLWEINQKGENDKAIQRVFNQYPELSKKLIKENILLESKLILMKIYLRQKWLRLKFKVRSYAKTKKLL